MEAMKIVLENYLKHSFEQWKIRIELCRNRGGEILLIEEHTVKVVKETKLKMS